MKARLFQDKNQVFTAAFLVMMLTPILLYFAARNGSLAWMGVLLGLVILANVAILLEK